jgi:hypothetical protein
MLGNSNMDAAHLVCGAGECGSLGVQKPQCFLCTRIKSRGYIKRIAAVGKPRHGCKSPAGPAVTVAASVNQANFLSSPSLRLVPLTNFLLLPLPPLFYPLSTLSFALLPFPSALPPQERNIYGFEGGRSSSRRFVYRDYTPPNGGMPADQWIRNDTSVSAAGYGLDGLVWPWAPPNPYHLVQKPIKRGAVHPLPPYAFMA